MSDSSRGHLNMVYWCRACGVPLLQQYCGNCGEQGLKMVSDLRPVFEEEKQLLERLTNEIFPRETLLLWMRQRTLWYDGRRYLRFSGDNKPQIRSRYDMGGAYSGNGKRNYIEKLFRANELTLDKLQAEAIEFIKRATKQFANDVPLVSFSGGKDSVVVSHLVRKALHTDSVTHIFGDTGNEFPDTYDFIEQYSKNHPNIPFVWQRTDRDWFEMCDRLQPPSRLTAWCCSVFKATSIAKAIQHVRAEGRVLCFEGVRRAESARRRNRPEIATNSKIARQILARPILFWRDIDVWVYTLVNRLPINAAYRYGLSRVGCLNCPHHTPRVDWWLQQMYPEHTERWRIYITDYARNKLGKDDPEEYWASGAWKARVGNNGAKPRGQLETRPCDDDDSVNFILQREFDADELMNFLKPLGKVEKIGLSLGSCIRVSRGDRPLLQVWGVDGLPRAKLSIFGENDKRLLTHEITRQLRKYQACVYCGMCEAICRHGSIRVTGDTRQYLVDESSCTNCLDCVLGNRIKGTCVAINTSYGRPRYPDSASPQRGKVGQGGTDGARI